MFGEVGIAAQQSFFSPMSCGLTSIPHDLRAKRGAPCDALVVIWRLKGTHPSPSACGGICPNCINIINLFWVEFSMAEGNGTSKSWFREKIPLPLERRSAGIRYHDLQNARRLSLRLVARRFEIPPQPPGHAKWSRCTVDDQRIATSATTDILIFGTTAMKGRRLARDRLSDASQWQWSATKSQFNNCGAMDGLAARRAPSRFLDSSLESNVTIPLRATYM